MRTKYIIIIMLALPIIVLICYQLYTFIHEGFWWVLEGKTVYPLIVVDVNDDAEYMIVIQQGNMRHSYNMQYDVVTDSQVIKDNASIFSYYNPGVLYNAKDYNFLYLYKNGEEIERFPFRYKWSRNIKYGTLVFERINGLQFDLMTGYKIIEQSEYYTILMCIEDESTYYKYYVHGPDLDSPDTVYRPFPWEKNDEMPEVGRITNRYVEFVDDNTFGPRLHKYLRLSDYQLSNTYREVENVYEEDGTLIIEYRSNEAASSGKLLTDVFPLE